MLIRGDARTLPLADGSVQCVVTSPPYWGLRDYGLPPSVWDAADGCAHAWGDANIRAEATTSVRWQHTQGGGTRADGSYGNRHANSGTDAGDARIFRDVSTGFCRSCPAWRGVLGLEPTPELFVAHLVQVFREVRRVLRADGVVWCNLGDSYAGGHGPSTTPGISKSAERNGHERTGSQRWADLKPKDLVGIPWRCAFALQADGWYLRADVIWAKPNPMPESVTDRPTKAHEYLFLLAKSERYFYDAEAVREPAEYGRREWTNIDGNMAGIGMNGTRGHATVRGADPAAGRNRRSVWTIATEPYPEAHFATFPEALVAPCLLAGTSERGACAACGAPWERVVRPTAEYSTALAKPPLRPHKDEFDFLAFGQYLRERRETAGLSRAEVDTALGTNTAYAWWEGRNYMGAWRQQPPSWPLYLRLKDLLGLDDRFDGALEAYRVRILRPGDWEQQAEDVLKEGNRKGGPARTADYETTGWRATCACAAPSRPCVVLDPFAGSGTVGAVAERFGRQWIGVDLKPDYLAMARRRTAQLGLRFLEPRATETVAL